MALSDLDDGTLVGRQTINIVFISKSKSCYSLRILKRMGFLLSPLPIYIESTSQQRVGKF